MIKIELDLSLDEVSMNNYVAHLNSHNFNHDILNVQKELSLLTL